MNTAKIIEDTEIHKIIPFPSSLSIKEKKITDRKMHIKIRIVKDKIFKYLVVTFSILSFLPLLLILFHIIKNGISVINWGFLTEIPRPIGENGGGIFNAIVGSLVLILLSGIISIPIGISTGIYLAEKSKGRLANIINLCIIVLHGTPSIVIGIITYLWVVAPLGGFSALSGGIALGIMMLPVIIKSTEETLKLIPYHLKEASLALGVPYYKTILKVILPTGLSGILTGILLSVARITGETAPLLFTAFGNQFLNYNIFKPIDSLPYRIFYYAMSPYPEWHAFAWGASFILVGIVLIFNLIARGASAIWKVQF